MGLADTISGSVYQVVYIRSGISGAISDLMLCIVWREMTREYYIYEMKRQNKIRYYMIMGGIQG